MRDSAKFGLALVAVMGFLIWNSYTCGTWNTVTAWAAGMAALVAITFGIKALIK